MRVGFHAQGRTYRKHYIIHQRANNTLVEPTSHKELTLSMHLVIRPLHSIVLLSSLTSHLAHLSQPTMKAVDMTQAQRRLRRSKVVCNAYVTILLAVVVGTLGLGILAGISTNFLDFEDGLNAVSSNVLQVNNEVLPNCQAYGACCNPDVKPYKLCHDGSYYYTTYFREWFVQPTDRFELWVALLMANPIVDIVESATLFSHLPEWTRAARSNDTAAADHIQDPTSPNMVCEACVQALAVGLAARAVVMVISTIFVLTFNKDLCRASPIVDSEMHKLECVAIVGMWCWVGLQAVCAVMWLLGVSIYQGNILQSYCTSSVEPQWYGVALFFSFVPGVAVMPLVTWSLQHTACTVLHAVNAHIFFPVPLVVSVVMNVSSLVVLVMLVWDSFHLRSALFG